MTVVEQALVDFKIEQAQNEIRAEHNELESKRWFGKKHYFAYDSSKFIAMMKLLEKEGITK